MLSIPVGVWSVVLPQWSGKLFDMLVARRKFEAKLNRLRIRIPPHSKYFRVGPGFPKTSTWRFFQIVSIVIVVASYLTRLLRGLSILSTQDEPVAFFLLAFAALTLGVPIIVGILWVYEDAGVRRIDPQSSTISKIGTPLEQFFVGFGRVLLQGSYSHCRWNQLRPGGRLLHCFSSYSQSARLWQCTFTLNITLVSSRSS